MEKRLFLLDGMALAYRAHFAFIARPIRTSGGTNTSALFGFANTLLELIENQKPTHMAVVFDTSVPTARHELYPPYKANREDMPEELSEALPHLQRFAKAFGVKVVTKDGYEADDIIGTLAGQAESEGFETFMVTPDKDFGQLVSEHVNIYKPGTKGGAAEILGVPEVLSRWEIERVEQVIDMLGLIGDSSDNIPGVPGVGPKTAVKLIGQFGSLENLLEHANEVKGKMGEKLAEFAKQARLSKTLATIDTHVPLDVTPDALAFAAPNTSALEELFKEFEFRTLAKRTLGVAAPNQPPPGSQGELFGSEIPRQTESEPSAAHPTHQTIADVGHDYSHITDTPGRAALAAELAALKAFCFDTETTGLEPRSANLVGLSFSWEAGKACFVRMPAAFDEAREALEVFRSIFADEKIEKSGHNLKFDLAVLKRYGIEVEGPIVDTMLVHALIAPEQRHGMDYLSEVHLDYSPIPITTLIGDGKESPQKTVAEAVPERLAEYAAEDADVTWQLRGALLPLLREQGQERVYNEVEGPLVRVLVDMEHEGIALDPAVLEVIGKKLEEQTALTEKAIFDAVGHEFNLNSPKQLGEVLFDELKLSDKPKKTRTGQYATNEQTLLSLATTNPIVQSILDYRETVKLKNTYVDALPAAIDPNTGRVHTNFSQLRAATGRLASDNPNLQNIPIRSAQGREIRRAFVARSPDWLLLSADYSQIELRIIAALSKDPGMLEAFAKGEDIHLATAAKVYGVPPKEVTREMRAKAKMVNFGIPYGISPFGLAQRLGASRTEAAELIDGYFKQFAGIRGYIEQTLEYCRKKGYAETVTGRRRYLPDINSSNGTIRGSAERNAINMPIQGTAADMIKIAMARIHRDLRERGLQTRLLLQVHDELLFEVRRDEEETVRVLVEDRMKNAIPLEVPIIIEMGTGNNWLEAH